MKLFYRDAKSQLTYVTAIEEVKGALARLQAVVQHHLQMMEWKHECFGKDLPPDDVLTVLQSPPRAPDHFREFLTASLEAIIMVIEKQYRRTFSEEVPMQSTLTAHTHNIDCEQVMGMLSAALTRAPNATAEFISCKIRAQLNKTTAFLDEHPPEEQEHLIHKLRRRGGYNFDDKC